MEQENNRQLSQIAASLETIAANVSRDKREEQYHSETHCPSCGRFVGTETRCPYCQAETQKRLSIRVFKVISVVISTLGLLMLLFYARNIQTPEVKISELGPLSNFAHVRVVGIVEKNAVKSKWGTVSFNIVQYVDEKGNIVTDRLKYTDSKKVEIKANAYKNVASEINEDNLPWEGDEVDVEGQIRVQQGDVSMLINAAEHIRVKASTKNQEIRNALKAEAIAPKSVTNEMISKYVKVLGIVKEIKQFKNDSALVLLENENNEAFQVFVSNYSKKKTASLEAGKIVECFGEVKLYNGKLEIEVSNRCYIKVMPN